jgi:hypothetical protein
MTPQEVMDKSTSIVVPTRGPSVSLRIPPNVGRGMDAETVELTRPEVNGKSEQTAFAEYEKAMRPFVKINQALGIRAANLMKSREKKAIVGWLLEQIMRIAPGRMIEFIINRSTRRITQAANAIAIKDYSRFLSSNKAAGRVVG